jgi:hypothetical protein
MTWPWEKGKRRQIGVEPVTPLTPAQIASDEAKALRQPYWLRLLLAIDDLGNVAVLNGEPGETMSSHFARMALENDELGKIACALLNCAQQDHGANAIIGDLTRAQIIAALEENSGIPT